MGETSEKTPAEPRDQDFPSASLCVAQFPPWIFTSPHVLPRPISPMSF